jgi:thermitase
MAVERGGKRSWFGNGKRARRGQPRPESRLSQIVEALEGRQMLSAASIDVHDVLWNGKLVEAVRDEYVLRMPQLNAARATSVADFASRTPRTPAGWQVDPLGMGFYKLSAPGASEQIVTAWAQRQMVRYIEPNAMVKGLAVPNDPLYAEEPNWGFERIAADDAWDTSTGDASTVVAVLDTGIDYTHEDLVDNLWTAPDGSFGFNAITGSNDPRDDHGHGTFVSGIIGAVGDNGVGIAGVNWTTQIMSVKVLGANNVGSTASIISGINYVIDQQVAGQSVSVVNMSFGGFGFDQATSDALQSLAATGVVIVCAAGNDGFNNDFIPTFPANYQIPTLISVAASTEADELAAFSNFGSQTVHLAAPGDGVLSTRANNSVAFAPYGAELNYSVSSGTSFAAPFVAGAAALLKAVKPTATATQIRNAILDGVDEVPALDGLVATGGRLNLANAVDIILSTDGLPAASFKTGQVTRVVEGDKGYSFIDVTVELDRPPAPGKTAVVAYETRPGGSAFQGVDFVRQAGTVTFSGSQTERSFRLKIIADRVPEQDERFAVQLVAARSRDVLIDGLVQQNITIVDDDFETEPTIPEPTEILVPRVMITPLVDEDGDRIRVVEGQAAEFVVYLDRVSNKPVTVRYRTHEPAVKPVEFATAGRDYVSATGTVTFRPGETRKVISVKTLVDSQLEVIDPATGRQKLGTDGNPLPEIFNVLLYDPVNAVLSGTDSLGVAEILDKLPSPPAPPPGAGGFTITVQFTQPIGLTPTQQSVFAQAADRWEEIIVGDLPDVVDPTTGQTIDDVLIEASAEDIDGPGGVLGAAGPTEFRAGAAGLPWKGRMFFDTADLAEMEADGSLLDVIIHEMAHVIGFGTAWERQSLVTGSDFVGANAVREYNSIFGGAATGVPLETDGGAGTAGSHWSKNLFGSELMTGFLSPGVTRPISRVTVGQFQDLGYQVSYSAADAYSPPLKTAPVGRPLPIRLPGSLPVAPTPPVSTKPIAGLPVVPPKSEPIVVRPPVNPTVPVAPAPVNRTPVTRVPVTRTPVSGQPVSGTPIAGGPVSRQPVTRI